MPYQRTEIDGVYLFIPRVFRDSRGEFYESFRSDQALAETELKFQVAQVNNSSSQRGAIRGIHFKENPPGQQKFVSVTSGAIIDVVIDLRKSSSTFKKWEAFQLDDSNRHSLLIGNGIGHSYLSLRDETKVSYLCDTVFESEKEHGINPFSAGIEWEVLGIDNGIVDFLISDKDREALDLVDAYSMLPE